MGLPVGFSRGGSSAALSFFLRSLHHDQDVDHVRHMHHPLKPGSILVTVTAPAWQYRMDKKYTEFRSWPRQLSHEVEDLPEGTFKCSGTNVPALLMAIRN
jgi:hypothetical protein